MGRNRTGVRGPEGHAASTTPRASETHFFNGNRSSSARLRRSTFTRGSPRNPRSRDRGSWPGGTRSVNNAARQRNSLLQWKPVIEREIETQHVHPRLAEKPEVPRSGFVARRDTQRQQRRAPAKLTSSMETGHRARD